MEEEQISTKALYRIGKESGITLEKSNRKAHGLNINTIIHSRDKLRPALNGVFYDGGVAVKTNGRALCAIRCEYPQAYEGKVIGESGEEIEAKFPKWRSVIPKSGYELDLQKFLQAIDGLPKWARFVIIHNNVFRIKDIKNAVLFIRKAKNVRLYMFDYRDAPRQFIAVADGGIFLQLGSYLSFPDRKYAVNIKYDETI